MNFREKWKATVERKKSVLCINLDPAELKQRDELNIKQSDKIQWSLDIIDQTAQYAAAIKPNRQYYKDLSRQDMLKINQYAKDRGLLSIDDSKISDIGSTNDAALFHAVEEGFDAITYAPFPGNLADTCQMALKRNIGLIPLVLMSNPEYKAIKSLEINQMKYWQYLAIESEKHQASGIVVGAPSTKNHISHDELNAIAESISQDMTVLVPGIGAQGGAFAPIIEAFGKRSIISVGRDIAYHESPKERAAYYFKEINRLLF
ncbi:MAG: orotidine 5'-phosphate decarboxylase [Pseudobacteriovorax sp.]|nr:orotidine 5'-phosphate decarboxylase [Pseudobacteriovorax sp.]